MIWFLIDITRRKYFSGVRTDTSPEEWAPGKVLRNVWADVWRNTKVGVSRWLGMLPPTVLHILNWVRHNRKHCRMPAFGKTSVPGIHLMDKSSDIPYDWVLYPSKWFPPVSSVVTVGRWEQTSLTISVHRSESFTCSSVPFPVCYLYCLMYSRELTLQLCIILCHAQVIKRMPLYLVEL